jgi:hypothetical protein
MDLAVILPLAALLVFQCLLSLGLLLPKGVSKPIASLISAAGANPGAKSAVLAIAGAIFTMTLSALIQLYGVANSLKSQQFSDRCAAQRHPQLPAHAATAISPWRAAAASCAPRAPLQPSRTPRTTAALTHPTPHCSPHATRALLPPSRTPRPSLRPCRTLQGHGPDR